MSHAKTMSMCRHEECAEAVEKIKGRVLREKWKKTDSNILPGWNLSIYSGYKLSDYEVFR